MFDLKALRKRLNGDRKIINVAFETQKQVIDNTLRELEKAKHNNLQESLYPEIITLVFDLCQGIVAKEGGYKNRQEWKKEGNL